MSLNIKDWIAKNIPSNGIIFEAGTSDGYDTCDLANVVKDGKLYAFEPIKALYDVTVGKIRNYTNIEYFNAALSTKDGKEIMHVSYVNGEPYGSSSILEPKEHLIVWPTVQFNGTQEVDAINLDNFLLVKQINNIDFMWLDLQGYEPTLLKDSPITLSRTKYIYTEVSTTELYKDTILKNEFIDLLQKNNFEVIWDSTNDQPGVCGDILVRNTLLT